MKKVSLIILFVLLISIIPALKVVAQVSIFDYYYTDQADEIEQLNKQIKNKKKSVGRLKGLAAQYRRNIKNNQKKVLSYQEQIKEMEDRIAETKIDIERIGVEREQIELEIKKSNIELTAAQQKTDKFQKGLSLLIRKIYLADQKNYLDVLLLNNSFSEFFNQVRFLNNTKDSVATQLGKVKMVRLEMESKRSDLEAQNQELAILDRSLNNRNLQLANEIKSKQILVKKTVNSQAEYIRLLKDLQQEQARIDAELIKIDKEIKERLAKSTLKFKWNPKTQKLLWPIPNHGITTYFHDPNYPFRRLVGEHTGLDLRTLINGRPSPGVPVRAPAPGIVVKTIRGGKYVGNAIYIAHTEKMMTLYYHLSKVNVKKGDLVDAGDIIGATGGMPGMQGAGLSSGPHLHFEVRINQKPVDPLKYLQ